MYIYICIRCKCKCISELRKVRSASWLAPFDEDHGRDCSCTRVAVSRALSWWIVVVSFRALHSGHSPNTATATTTTPTTPTPTPISVPY